MAEYDLGYSEHRTLFHALKAEILRTVRTWRYARSIGADPTQWWGVYVHGTEHILASTGPLPGARERADKIIDALQSKEPHNGN